MKVYKLTYDFDNFGNLYMKPKLSIELIRSFDGRSHIDSWEPICLGRDKKEKKKELGDHPNFSLPIVSKRAVEALKDNLSKWVEFLPVETEADISDDFYIMNVTRVIDGIDYNKSRYVCFDSGKIMRFKKYVFIPEKVEGVPIFRIVDERLGESFVTDSFVELIDKNGLQGFRYDLVWDSENESNADAEEMEKCYQYTGILPVNLQQEVSRMIDVTSDIFDISRSDGRAAAEQIYHAVDDILETHRFPKEYADIEDVAVALGIMYGHAVCSFYGWTWGLLGENEQSAAVSIISPEKNYCMHPMNNMLRILKGENIGLDGRNDNTVLLLFNMLKDIDNSVPRKKYTPLS